ncbi:MAG: PD-(D/E)XK nuclease family protein [Elusimicrobia bacterium]|nr:PD-(D/E)XK nuclease family protein [Elusimicrobiota bacterium]
MRPLSHSSITLYLDCPQKYKFRYIDKIPEKPKHFFSFGRSVHSALEYFYNVPAAPPPGLPEVLAHYKARWVSEGYKDASQEAEYFDEGRRILEQFHARHAPQFAPPFFAEYRFDLKVDGIPVTGFVDRIDRVGSDRIAIIDYKTGKSFGEDRVRADAQLTMYQMACEELLGLRVESLTFYHLNSLTPLTAPPHSADQVAGLRRRIVSVADSIRKEAFEPRPEERKCTWCDYKPLCPVFRADNAPLLAGSSQGLGERSTASAPPLLAGSSPDAAREEFHLARGTGRDTGGRGSTSSAPVLAAHMAAGNASGGGWDFGEDAELAALIDRYGRLLEEISGARTQAQDLSAEISSRLQELGGFKAFSSRYEANLSLEEKWEFSDKAKILDAIRRAGRWEDVLAPSAPLVQKLLEDPAVPRELRERLLRLAKKVTRPSLQIKKLEPETAPG